MSGFVNQYLAHGKITDILITCPYCQKQTILSLQGGGGGGAGGPGQVNLQAL